MFAQPLQGEFRNDTYVFDKEVICWNALAYCDQSPTPRRFHAAFSQNTYGRDVN